MSSASNWRVNTLLWDVTHSVKLLKLGGGGSNLV
jgi:hypothetical protein